MYEQKHLITIGLLVGAFKPLLAMRLVQINDFREMTRVLSSELGIQIYMHEPIRDIVLRIEKAFEGELREYNATRKN